MPFSDISCVKKARFLTNVSSLLVTPPCSLFPDRTHKPPVWATRKRAFGTPNHKYAPLVPERKLQRSLLRPKFNHNPATWRTIGYLQLMYIRFAYPYCWALDGRALASSTSLQSFSTVPSRYATQHHVAPDGPTAAILPLGSG